MAMDSVQNVFEEQIIPIKSAIHDCVDTGTLQALSDGVRTLYTNDKATYEVRSGDTDLWDSVNSTVIDSILYSKIDIKVGGTMNASSANSRLKVELIIDVGGTGLSEILVEEIELEISRVGVDIKRSITFIGYNGSAALADGFKVYLTAIGGTISISDSHILVRV